ncbi:hypothetical protein Bbelb_152430 [Branchiostoma belcheri]|nr:hypothetical protein Bbelb_152430 [Branchiostoma belcheri]
MAPEKDTAGSLWFTCQDLKDPGSSEVDRLTTDGDAIRGDILRRKAEVRAVLGTEQVHFDHAKLAEPWLRVSSRELVVSKDICSRELVVSKDICSRELVVGKDICSRKLVVSKDICSRELVVSKDICSRELVVSKDICSRKLVVSKTWAGGQYSEHRRDTGEPTVIWLPGYPCPCLAGLTERSPGYIPPGTPVTKPCW